MNRDTKSTIAIVVVALLLGSIPVITPLVFGIGVQIGAWSNQTIYSVTFLSITRLSWLYLSVSIAGLGLSQYFHNRNPKKFRLTSISFVMLLLGTILSAIISAWIYINNVEFGLLYSSASCVSVVAQFITWIILLFVIFSPKFNSVDEISNKE